MPRAMWLSRRLEVQVPSFAHVATLPRPLVEQMLQQWPLDDSLPLLPMTCSVQLRHYQNYDLAIRWAVQTLQTLGMQIGMAHV